MWLNDLGSHGRSKGIKKCMHAWVISIYLSNVCIKLPCHFFLIFLETFDENVFENMYINSYLAEIWNFSMIYFLHARCIIFRQYLPTTLNFTKTTKKMEKRQKSILKMVKVYFTPPLPPFQLFIVYIPIFAV